MMNNLIIIKNIYKIIIIIKKINILITISLYTALCLNFIAISV